MSYKSKKHLDAKSSLSNSSDAFDQKFAAKYKAEIDEVQFDAQQREALLAQLRYEKARTINRAKRAPLHRQAIHAFVSILILGLAVSFIWSQYQNLGNSSQPDTNGNQAVGQWDDESSSSSADMNTADYGQESATEANSNSGATDSAASSLASDLPTVVDPDGSGQPTGAGPAEEAATSSLGYPFQEDVEDWYLNFLIDKEIDTSSANDGSTGGGSQGSIGFPSLKPENAYNAAAEWMAFRGLIQDAKNQYQILANHRFIAESQTHEFLLYIYNEKIKQADVLELSDSWSVESLDEDGWHAEVNTRGESIHALSASLDAIGPNLYKRIDDTRISLPTPTYLLLRFEGNFDTAIKHRLSFRTAEGQYYLGFSY